LWVFEDMCSLLLLIQYLIWLIIIIEDILLIATFWYAYTKITLSASIYLTES